MRTFDYMKLADRMWDSEILTYVAKIHEYKGKQELYVWQKLWSWDAHRDLLKHAGLSYGGQFKNIQNHINETKPDGTVVTRFTPLAPYETEPAIGAICESYRQTLAMEVIDPLILIPTFICDFLCIHPFNDGNGRMSRLLTLLLLYQNSYEVGKYISVEKKIEETKDVYYGVLECIDAGCMRNRMIPRHSLSICFR